MDPVTLLGVLVPLASMIFPAAVDFFKKKFIPAANDSPERTMGTLATTKPETLGPYVQSLAAYLEAQVKFFNRDVIGNASKWVVDSRAIIRPLCVVGSLIALALEYTGILKLDPATRTGMLSIVTNWVGSRVV